MRLRKPLRSILLLDLRPPLRKPLRSSLLLGLPLVVGLSCTRYEFLTQDVYEQATYSNTVDILFVVDNSGSMVEEQNELSTNFQQFIQNLNAAARQEATFPHENLTDAVSNYLFFLNNFDGYINFRIGVTTTELGSGQNGMLVAPYPDDPDAPLYITADDVDPVTAFTDAIGEVQANPAVAGEEQGLGAMRRAVCMSLEDPSGLDERTRTDLALGCSDVIDAGETGGNGDFLRDGVALAVIVVSDEGDSSDGQIDDYLDFLDALDRGYSVSAIAPTLPVDSDDTTPSCNPEGSPYETLERYREMVDATHGLLAPICDDFAGTLDDVSRLINNLLVRFELRQVPREDSILVFVDGVEIPHSETDGWIYVPSTNSIEFTGDAVPDYNATIEVYYRTVTDTDPRSLPF